jgi:beta-galactosidase
MKQGPKLNFYRPVTENDVRDRHGKRAWHEAGLNSLTQGLSDKLEVQQVSGNHIRIMAPTNLKSMETGTRIQAMQQYDIFADGSIQIGVVVELPRSVKAVAKVGYQTLLEKAIDQVSWYGLGPVATYNDRDAAGKFGYYQSTAQGIYDHNLVVPQDNANRSHVQWATITNVEGIGFYVNGTEPINFSAYPYLDSDIDKARHINELEEADAITLNIDHKQAGLGTATCGPGVLPQYVLSEKSYQFQINLSPIDLKLRTAFEYGSEETAFSSSKIAMAPQVNFTRLEDGRLELSTEEPATIVYKINDGKEKKYTDAIDLRMGGSITAYSTTKGLRNSFTRQADFDILKTQWKVMEVSSSHEGFPAENAFDNNKDTHWHSNWHNPEEKMPHFITVDMGEAGEFLSLIHI